jgi:hypothetical protein
VLRSQNEKNRKFTASAERIREPITGVLGRYTKGTAWNADTGFSGIHDLSIGLTTMPPYVILYASTDSFRRFPPHPAIFKHSDWTSLFSLTCSGRVHKQYAHAPYVVPSSHYTTPISIYPWMTPRRACTFKAPSVRFSTANHRIYAA